MVKIISVNVYERVKIFHIRVVIMATVVDLWSHPYWVDTAVSFPFNNNDSNLLPTPLCVITVIAMLIT